MKKIIVPLMLMSLVSLCSCNSGEDMSQRTMRRIKEAYYLKYVSEELDVKQASEIEILQYYGKYNGFYVLLFNPVNCFNVVSKDTINQSVFTYANSNHILAFKDELLTLKETYKRWLITGDDIRAIHQIHLDNFSSLNEYNGLEMGEEIVLEDKIIWTGSIDDNFTNDMVMVTIDKTFKDATFKITDFKSKNIAEIDWLTGGPDTFHSIGFLMLKNKTKAKVVETIKEVENLDFVKSAEPNYIGGQLS